MEKNKLNFLQSIQNDNSLTEIVKLCLYYKLKYKYSAYTVLTQYNTNKNNARVSAKALLSLYKKAYDLMYQYVEDISNKTAHTQQFEILRKKYLSGELKKDLTPEQCKEFFFEECIKFSTHPPVHAQHGADPIYQDFVTSDFIHVYPFEYPSKIDCRLYLNTTPENSCKIGELLLEESFKIKRRVYFKFDTEGSRNDSMLLYCSYENANIFVELLEKIKKEHPELFIGATKSGVITGSVNDFISYGEEPQYTHSSFNSERADSIDEFISAQLEKNRKAIGNYNGYLNTSENTTLNLKDYLIYRIKKSFMETIKQNIIDIKNNNFPKEITDKNRNDYIEIQNNMYTTYNKTLPDHIIKQIETQATSIIQDLKNGNKARLSSISIPTKRTSLTFYAEEYAAKLLAKNGYLTYSFHIDLDIEEKLFEIFNVSDKIEKNITIENLEPYFTKHHCSVVYPHLNTETEKELTNALNV